MNVNLINKGTEAEIFLDGRLDTNTAPEVDGVFADVIEKFEKVVLNLEKLEYISSAGLRTIKKLHVGMKKKGGNVVLTHTNKMVMEVFEMTGFAGLLRFE